MNQQYEPCGTQAAYVRHQRNSEEPCEPCRDAAAIARAESRAKIKHQRATELQEMRAEHALPDSPSHLDYLHWLVLILRQALTMVEPHQLPSLGRQLRETLAEIATLEVHSSASRPVDSYDAFMQSLSTEPDRLDPNEGR